MTHKQILEQALRKAQNNGFYYLIGGYGTYLGTPPSWEVYEPHIKKPRIRLIPGNPSEGEISEIIDPYAIIFRHDFAKAFWGSQKLCLICLQENDDHLPSCRYKKGDLLNLYAVETWQYHLPRMVLKEDPIEYLEQFI